MLVARDGEGQLRKIPIPLHYLYVFLSGAVIGMLTITGMAGSYARMLWKVSHFNQLRSQTVALKTQYNTLEKAAQEKEIQVASLGSLANEVSTMYGLKSEPVLAASPSGTVSDQQIATSIGQLYALKSSAMSGAAISAHRLNSLRFSVEVSEPLPISSMSGSFQWPGPA